jgi:hypothetical protein
LDGLLGTAADAFISLAPGTPFPPNFKEVVKTIFKRLFRVYAHTYHSHFQKIVSLKEEAHLNTCFKHFILFTNVSMNLEDDTITHKHFWPRKKKVTVKLTFMLLYNAGVWPD